MTFLLSMKLLMVALLMNAAMCQDDISQDQLLPSVVLASSVGGKVNLPKDLLGKWTLLYFYPKDETPGCTKQACSYRDNLPEFTQLGVSLYGVSLDDLKSHDSFVQKYHLNFPLLVDSEHKLGDALKVYGKQSWGMGMSRDTFLIGPNGRIRRVWRKVKPENTMKETLDAVKKEMAATKS